MAIVNNTTLPHPKYLKTDSVPVFDGTPSELDSFDISVKQLLLQNNLPLYYGGTVQGDPADDYVYVASGGPHGKSNYVLGARLCAGLTTRLEKAALRWWQDYDGNSSKPSPNCWKKHSDHPRPVANSIPEGIVEVSLFDLLKEHFNSDMDSREAELELERFRWKPFEKNGMNVTVFRGHVERLMKRANTTGAFARVRAIRNCLPQKIKDVVWMETSETKLWDKIHKIYVTFEIDYVDKQCANCGKSGHTADVCHKGNINNGNKKKENNSNSSNSGAKSVCSHCQRPGHSEPSCWAKHGRPASATNTSSTADSRTNWRSQSSTNNSSTTGTAPNYVKVRRTCFRCGKDDHMIKDCPQTPVNTVTTAAGATTPSTPASTLYAIPQILPGLHFTERTVPFVDSKEVVLDDDGLAVPLPLHFALTQNYAVRDVFEVDRPSSSVRPSGCLWSLSSTVVGQQLLTIWDTGAVVAVVPESTIVQTGTSWVRSSDVEFVMADGIRHAPLGHAPRFVFRIASLYFVLKVYVVASANYQLLLGTSFMHECAAALFPSWQTVMLTRPIRLSIRASTDAIDGGSCPPLQNEADEAVIEIHRLETEVFRPQQLPVPVPPSVTQDGVVEMRDPLVLFINDALAPPFTPVLTMNATVGTTYRLGIKDLVSEVESEQPERLNKPVLTSAFVASNIEFAADVPDIVRGAVCQDIIDYSHVFSWNAFDLGCIADVPHRVIRTDSSPAVQASRHHLYTPLNEKILHEKCDPYIDMGIFSPAPLVCKDRAQVTIVRTGSNENRHDPRYCRIAHDFRTINDKIQADPEPVDSVVDMLAWMGDSPTGLFFTTDADRGFYQIVCASDDDGESINSTCFELFHQLWVSSRILFGQKNGPATFKRNAIIMQGDLLREKKTKSYFDDIIGKADHYEALRDTWISLLEQASHHGWKFKPTKTKWGFSTIETVGFEWSPPGIIGMGKKNREAVKNLSFPRNKSELRGVLGLANQFRERIAGYELLVTCLTSLTRGPEKKIVATPEALIEFQNLKAILNSPPVLQQFQHGRPTFVYTDASVGSKDGDIDIPGGLGVVIVQTAVDNIDYVCAYASAGLTPAQRNYHIVRLELLAFVYACGKFYDWLAGGHFVWRSDCRAHEFLHKAKYSSNATIARYALTLSEFDFTVEWVPGLAMIADPMSRMVLHPCEGSEAMTLPEIVFGQSMGARIASIKRKIPPPLLHFQPQYSLVVQAPCMLEVDLQDVGWQSIDVLAHAIVPLGGDMALDGRDVELGVLRDIPLYPVDAIREHLDEGDTPDLEELDLWPKLTKKEHERLKAVRCLREWIRSKERMRIDDSLRMTLKDIGRNVTLVGDTLWKSVKGPTPDSPPMQLEVLDTPERLRDVLLACHEGLGHRQLRSVYKHFSRRYWVPAAGKLIRRHILACKTCQCFASANRGKVPGFAPTASDVFQHWSIDFAGPFPKDSETGMQYVLIAVEWVTRWAEAEATLDASPETAADFLYSRVICRFGCFQSLQSDNGSHFVNPILRNLTKILKIKHHFQRLTTPKVMDGWSVLWALLNRCFDVRCLLRLVHCL